MESLVSGHLDGLLSPRQEAQLLHHLDDCHTCASRLARYRQMDLMLRRLQSREPPTELRQAVLDGADKKRPLVGFSWGTMVAATAVFVVAAAISAAGVRWPLALPADIAAIWPAAYEQSDSTLSAGTGEANRVAEVSGAASADDAAVLVEMRRTLGRPGFRPLLPGYLPRGARLSAVNFGRGVPGGPIDRLEVAFAAGRDQLSLRQLASAPGSAAPPQPLAPPVAIKKVNLGGHDWLVVRPAHSDAGNAYVLVGERGGMTIWLESSIPMDELERVAASLRD